MSSVNVNFRMDEELKKDMERTCRDMGMSMTTAFTIFAKKVSKEQRIPFEISVDPFWSAENQAYLKTSIAEANEGKLTEHDLIEV